LRPLRRPSTETRQSSEVDGLFLFPLKACQEKYQQIFGLLFFCIIHILSRKK
jgi:hypothetical protein